VKTLPAVREAVEQRQWDRVDTEVGATAEALEAFAAEVEKASAALGRAIVN
jgi:N-acetylated-alpha-linked acidic dipeptidase